MYQTRTLSNGIRVIAENVDYVHSVSIGLFVHSGSAHEPENIAGISHFIEHMLFKGTTNRTAKDIAAAIDNVGGHINAFTTKEYTCYYIKLLDTHFGIGVDILSDMLKNSKFLENDVDLERKVIGEEIGMYEDSPEDLVHDMIAQCAWGDKGIGRSIIGTHQTLSTIDSAVLKGYLNKNYTPSNIVIGVAGNFDESIFDMLEEKFSGINGTDEKRQKHTYPFRKNFLIKNKDTEQVHLCIAFEGFKAQDEELYPFLAFNNTFGNGMSSAMFQSIREEKGLVYSIYSYSTSIADTGMFVIYAGTNPENLKEVTKLIFKEIDNALESTIDQNALYSAKEQLKGNYILGLESISSRMQSIGRAKLLFDKVKTPEEILTKIEQITPERVSKAVNRVFNKEKMCLAAIGNLDVNDHSWFSEYFDN